MKKLIAILILFLLLASCEKETNYIELKTTVMHTGVVNYQFINRSGYKLNAKAVFYIESDCMKRYETDCIPIEPYGGCVGRFEVGCEPYFVESKITLCK